MAKDRLSILIPAFFLHTSHRYVKGGPLIPQGSDMSCLTSPPKLLRYYRRPFIMIYTMLPLYSSITHEFLGVKHYRTLDEQRVLGSTSDGN